MVLSTTHHRLLVVCLVLLKFCAAVFGFVARVPAATALGDETIARLQKDYRDLQDAVHFQAKYYQQLAATEPAKITEDSLERTAYLAHLQRFQQEEVARDATRDCDHAIDDLKKEQELQRLRDFMIIEDSGYKLAQAKAIKAEAREEQAFRVLELLKGIEKHLRDALEELQEANDVDQWSNAEMHQHEAQIRTFKTHLIDHDPFKGNVAF